MRLAMLTVFPMFHVRNKKNLRILVADMHDPDNRTTDYGYPQAEDDG